VADARFDEIGYWSQVKLDIVRAYASTYSRILAKQADLYHVYIDGFAGSGVHLRKLRANLSSAAPSTRLRSSLHSESTFWLT